ncbi:ferredoxin [Mycobacterium sp. 141]|uniref:NADH-quinone oxidoreductase subunit B family protein n=1 Tax=Mycobacterium sp. 141 TaxID=1120797 RepID=UPI0003721EDF|nr:ferredoxin [Mycobacterium sp. 141]
MPWMLRGLRNGVLTSRWPARPDPYFSAFAGAVKVVRAPDSPQDLARIEQAAAACPTAAITVDPAVRLDRGRCIMCGRCIDADPAVFGWDIGSDTGVVDRESLVVGQVDESEEALAHLRVQLARRVRRLRRSVHLRHVDAGSDGSDEWEVQALTNPVYDIHRLGLFFTASPRHADILLVTGIGTAGMIEPLRRTLQAMPAPTVVIAAGTDAISGGLIGGGYTGGTGVGDIVPVDIWVPGSPATPFSLLHAILLALGRVEQRSRTKT